MQEASTHACLPRKRKKKTASVLRQARCARATARRESGVSSQSLSATDMPHALCTQCLFLIIHQDEGREGFFPATPHLTLLCNRNWLYTSVRAPLLSSTAHLSLSLSLIVYIAGSPVAREGSSLDARSNRKKNALQAGAGGEGGNLT